MTEAFVQVLWDVYGVSQAGWFSAVTLLPDPSSNKLGSWSLNVEALIITNTTLGVPCLPDFRNPDP